MPHAAAADAGTAVPDTLTETARHLVREAQARGVSMTEADAASLVATWREVRPPRVGEGPAAYARRLIGPWR